MLLRFSCLLLLAGCAGPDDHPAAAPAARPAPVEDARYVFLRQTQHLSPGDQPAVRAEDGVFFCRQPYPLTADLAERLPPAGAVPLPVLQAFRQQLRHLDTAALRRFSWQAARLGPLVLVDSLGQQLASQPGFGPAIRGWNRSPRAERFMGYASVPLFAAAGRYALIVRGQTQESIGWDALFVYERTAQGWKIRAATPLSSI